MHVVNGAAEALADWLQIRGDDPGPLFWPIRMGGTLQRRQMTSQAIYDLLRKRARQTDVKPVSPHYLRRTFAGDLLDAGADIAIVQRFMGHSSPTTTSRYDRRPEAAKRGAAERLHVPYHRPARLFNAAAE